jgi:hypothetical protein
MRMPNFRWGEPRQLSAAVRVAGRRTPQTLTVVRHRAQPAAVTIVRLTVTALFAYLLALELTNNKHSVLVLAPLTSLLVFQVSLYQTLRSALTKVAAVVIGVLLAVGLSELIGFTWWSLTVTIAIALVIGYALRLGENLLEVPISAMIILSSGAGAAASQRIIETFVGTAAGLTSGFVLGTPKVESAEEAIGDLCDKIADLLGRMAAGLRDGSVQNSAADWLRQARAVSSEIQRVNEALRQAEESTRLNPRGVVLPISTVGLRQSLETLEHEAVTLRLFTRSLADSTGLGDRDSPVRDQRVQERLARVVDELSAAVRTYGDFTVKHEAADHERLEADLDRHLTAARDRQNELSELLSSDPAAKPTGWPLRGEVVSHLDRLRTDLCNKPQQRAHRRGRSLLGPVQPSFRRRRPRQG